jgi:cell division transport system permease protein
MRQLRIVAQLVLETRLGMKRSGWSNWLVIGILAVALTIFGGILQLTMTLKNVVNSWGSQVEISAYLKDGFDARQVARDASQLQNVSLIEIVPKEVAWEQMQQSFKVASLDNPLPNTLHVKVASVDYVERVADSLKAMEGVEHVRYPLKVAHSINRFRHFLEVAGIVITAALSAATLIVIGNTVHLVIEARNREIEILSLMGVSPWYIKGPLVLQGAAYGMGAAILAMLILASMHIYIDSYVQEQLVSFMPILPQGVEYGMWPTFLIMLSLGVVVGAGGSAWTSGRYIKV